MGRRCCERKRTTADGSGVVFESGAKRIICTTLRAPSIEGSAAQASGRASRRRNRAAPCAKWRRLHLTSTSARLFTAATSTSSSAPLEAAGLDQSSGRASGREDEVWLNRWITAAIAQKIRRRRDFFKHRAGKASPEDLRAFLANAPDVPLEPGDKTPDHLRVRLKPASARG
jgi:hypothetical protein